MCLILFAYRLRPDYPLVIAANRDESYTRPTAPAGFWADIPQVLAGRDLLHGGTWLGLTRGGRFAAVSNYRELTPRQPQTPSRGALVAGYLCGEETPRDYLQRIAAEDADYPGFNLIAGDQQALYYFSNRAHGVRELEPGLYGLSNALLDTPWPKVETGKRLLQDHIRPPGEPQIDALLEGLGNRRVPADGLLPDTGVGLQRERELAPLFIRSRGYGTRSSTVLFIGGDGTASLTERSYDPRTLAATTVHHTFAMGGVDAAGRSGLRRAHR